MKVEFCGWSQAPDRGNVDCVLEVSDDEVAQGVSETDEEEGKALFEAGGAPFEGSTGSL